MNDQSRGFRLVTLSLLYVSQALPLGFFVVAMPAILRAQGLSLERVGLLSALALPWLLKWAWAPLVDRWRSARGHYRGWLLPLQLGCVAAVAVIATLDVATDHATLLVAGGLFMLLSATQDVATDGLAVRLVRPEERGLANGIQVGGYYLGQILGGGGAVVLVGTLGWGAAMTAIAGVLALPVIWVARLREPPPPADATAHGIDFAALGRFFRRPGIGGWVALLLLWRAGETMAQWMFNPLLVDRGFRLEEIGLLLGVVGSLASLAGAALGGLLTQRLGRRRAMILFGSLCAGALALYLLPALEVGGMAAIYAAVAGVAAAGGMATAALYTGMMDRARSATAATDFTLQQSLAAVGPLVAAGVSGAAAAALGFTGNFVLAIVVQAVAVMLAAATRAIPEPAAQTA